MRLKIKHETRYEFDAPVRFGVQQIRKTPKTAGNQTVENWSVSVTGGQKQFSYEDHHRNTVDLVALEANTTFITLLSEGIVEVENAQGIVGKHQGPAPLWLYERPTPRTQVGRETKKLIRAVKKGDRLEQLHSLSQMVRNKVAYEIGASEPDWSAEDALGAGKGVCQDHTHVFLAAARGLGIPARYVSGYLMLNDREIQDATHAWAEAHIDGLGWVGFDISNGISPDDRYVRVATGLDYAEAAPIIGSRMGAAGETLQVQLEVAQQ